MTCLESRRCYLYVRLAFNPVEIFMQAIQEEGKQLLAVLLPIALKLRGKLAQLILEVGGRDRCGVPLQQQ